MNQNYENYILHKYIIAVAFAIIKSKPPGQPLEEYVNDVRNKFGNREDLFQDVSISESDFANCDDDLSDVLETETVAVVPENNINTFYELDNNFVKGNEGHSEHNITEMSKIGVTSNEAESLNILNNIDYNEENTCQELARSSSIKEVLDIFKDIDKTRDNKILISTSTPNNAQSQSTNPPSGSNSQTHLTKALAVDNEITFCSFEDKDDTDKVDNQNTELYTVYGYTDNFSHISQSQDVNIVIPKKLIQNCNTISHNNYDKITTYKDKYNTNGSNVIVTKDNLCNSIVEESNIKSKANDINICHANGAAIDKSKKIKLSNNSVTKSSDEYSHLFAEILNDGNSQKYDETRKKCENFSGVFDKSVILSMSMLNELELESNSLLGGFKPSEQSLELNKIQNVECDVQATNIQDSFIPSDSHFIFSSTDSETQYKNNYVKHSSVNNIDKSNDVKVQRDDSVAVHNCKCGQLSSGYETQCASRNLVLESGNEIEDRSDTPEEIVTFKILEELNRVKHYLSKPDVLSDSGRSSQGSQLSSARINESGYCLFNYLVECPLTEGTLDIAEEVSRVLGEFVDKLHDDENCPQFVEKILDKAHELVNGAYKEDRTEDLFKKENQISRLLLLNKSVNITKFTIEKILPILQEVQLQLQKKDLLELYLVKTENLCYVLHILEVLLKRYNAAASSQASTQLSQDDEKSLKRSTITEIWRKKWNLSRSEVSEGSFKKKCVLAETSEVLNKIIVEGIDGYSLIAFAALQCFNLLQS